MSEDRDRALWLAIRRALLAFLAVMVGKSSVNMRVASKDAIIAMVRAIERRYDLDPAQIEPPTEKV